MHTEQRAKASSYLIVGSILLAWVAPATANAQSLNRDDRSRPTAAKPDSFVPARLHKWENPVFPESEFGKNDGWVTLNFVIRRQGHLTDLKVVESNGIKIFEREAKAHLQSLHWRAAKQNGRLVDTTMTMKVAFISSTDGPRNRFLRYYGRLEEAVRNKDQPRANQVLHAMQPQNLYEDAIMGLAQYQYAQAWAGKREQLLGLRRAIADEQSPRFLSEPAFQDALAKLLLLEVEHRDYARALITWEKLQKSGVDEAALAKVRPMMDKVIALQADGSPYAVAGTLADGSWLHDLFRRRLTLRVHQGHVAQLGLRCERRFVRLDFDSKLDYKIPESFGKCALEVIGDRDTQFELIQS